MQKFAAGKFHGLMLRELEPLPGHKLIQQPPECLPLTRKWA